MEMKNRFFSGTLKCSATALAKFVFPEAGGPAMMILAASQGEHQQKQRFFGLCGI